MTKLKTEKERFEELVGKLERLRKRRADLLERENVLLRRMDNMKRAAREILEYDTEPKES